MRRLIVFYRALPSDGSGPRVKSRIAEQSSLQAAGLIYRAMIQDLQENLTGLTDIIFPMPDRWHANGVGPFRPSRLQRGKDIGERMEKALSSSFDEGLEKVILIGSDIPQLRVEIICDCFRWLEECDMVLGPSLDGGYYLIGFSTQGFRLVQEASKPRLFRDMSWSTEKVYQETLKRAHALGLSLSIAPMLLDIDTLDDLEIVLHSTERALIPHTLSVYQSLFSKNGQLKNYKQDL